MKRNIDNRKTATPKQITGRRAYLIKKLEQKGRRYADKAERVTYVRLCNFYKIADNAFETAKRLQSIHRS